MGKPKFSLMDKTLNPEIVDGKMNAFVKVPYGIQVRLSHPLGKDGYGRVTVDGIPISRGKIFKLDMVIKADVLYLPVGEVAREFDREYTLELTGFKTAEGVPYPDCSFKIKTTAKSRPDPAFAENEEERQLMERRIGFYQRCGFSLLRFRLEAGPWHLGCMASDPAREEWLRWLYRERWSPTAVRA